MDELTGPAFAARDGDRQAFAAFVRRTQHEIWRFVARRTRADLVASPRAAESTGTG